MAHPDASKWKKEVTVEDFLELSCNEDDRYGRTDDEWYEKTDRWKKIWAKQETEERNDQGRRESRSNLASAGNQKAPSTDGAELLDYAKSLRHEGQPASIEKSWKGKLHGQRRRQFMQNRQTMLILCLMGSITPP
jgi:hypothetical protein